MTDDWWLMIVDWYHMKWTPYCLPQGGTPVWGKLYLTFHIISVINHQTSIISHQSSVINHQSSMPNDQSIVSTHQSSFFPATLCSFFFRASGDNLLRSFFFSFGYMSKKMITAWREQIDDWWVLTIDWSLIIDDWWLIIDDWWLMIDDWWLMTDIIWNGPHIVCPRGGPPWGKLYLTFHIISVINHQSSIINY